MATTYLVQNDNSIIRTNKERIIQKSNIVNSVLMLTDPIYNGLDMSEFDAYIEYVSPISKEYRVEPLRLNEELYKGELSYSFQIDTRVTKEFGNVDFQITFIKLDQDDEGEPLTYVRKTQPSYIEIVKLADWAQYIAPETLTLIDIKMAELQAEINRLETIIAEQSLIDGLTVDNNDTVRLASNGLPLGAGITLEQLGIILGKTDLDDVKIIEI